MLLYKIQPTLQDALEYIKNLEQKLQCVLDHLEINIEEIPPKSTRTYVIAKSKKKKEG